MQVTNEVAKRATGMDSLQWSLHWFFLRLKSQPLNYISFLFENFEHYSLFFLFFFVVEIPPYKHEGKKLQIIIFQSQHSMACG